MLVSRTVFGRSTCFDPTSAGESISDPISLSEVTTLFEVATKKARRDRELAVLEVESVSLWRVSLRRRLSFRFQSFSLKRYYISRIINLPPGDKIRQSPNGKRYLSRSLCGFRSYLAAGLNAAAGLIWLQV